MANIEQGTVTVNKVTFDWWTTDTNRPALTVSNPHYGMRAEPIRARETQVLARILAKELLAKKRW